MARTFIFFLSAIVIYVSSVEDSCKICKETIVPNVLLGITKTKTSIHFSGVNYAASGSTGGVKDKEKFLGKYGNEHTHTYIYI